MKRLPVWFGRQNTPDVSFTSTSFQCVCINEQYSEGLYLSKQPCTHCAFPSPSGEGGIFNWRVTIALISVPCKLYEVSGICWCDTIFA